MRVMMVMLAFMIMIVRVVVSVVVVMIMVAVLMNERFGRLARLLLALDDDTRPHACDMHAGRAFHLDLERTNMKTGQRRFHVAGGNAEFDQRAEQHVAAGSADALNMEMSHAFRSLTRASSHARFMMAAAMPAPNPLSILTTLMPGAHEFSIASNAATPPRFMP